jgi:hypothetical protein
VNSAGNGRLTPLSHLGRRQSHVLESEGLGTAHPDGRSANRHGRRPSVWPDIRPRRRRRQGFQHVTKTNSTLHTCRAQLLVPTGGGRNLSALCCRARRHSHAASHAHSPRPSSHVEAVGQHRGRTAAHTHCQAPRDVAAPLRLAPSRLQLPVRGPAPSNGVCRWSHAIAEKVRAGRRRAAIDADLLRLRLLHISFSVGDHLPGSSGLVTTIN